MELGQFFETVYLRVHLGLGQAAAEQYRIAIRLLERWAGRRTLVSDLSDGLVRSFLADYLGKVKPATVNAKRRLLLALWRCAADEGYAQVRPGKIRAAPEDLDEPEAWTADEFSMILSAAVAEVGSVGDLPAVLWWESLLSVIYDTGERISAILRTRPADIDYSAGGMYVRQRKNHRARWYALAGDTLELCRAMSADRDLMWPVPWSRNWLDERFRRILQRAGVRCGRGHGGLWHKLRRTSGSLVEAAGGDGSKHLGNTRAVFERHYRDPRICGASQTRLLPRPRVGRPPLRIVS